MFHQFVFVKNTLLLYSLYEFNRFNAGRSIIEKMKNPILNITRSLNWIWYYSALHSGKSLFRYIPHSFIYDGGTKIHFSFFRIVFLTYPFWQMGTKELSRQSTNNTKKMILYDSTLFSRRGYLYDKLKKICMLKRVWFFLIGILNLQSWSKASNKVFVDWSTAKADLEIFFFF